jgi:NhaP-type Na+/H+ or K+/H+ antiporter
VVFLPPVALAYVLVTSRAPQPAAPQSLDASLHLALAGGRFENPGEGRVSGRPGLFVGVALLIINFNDTHTLSRCNAPDMKMRLVVQAC